jgi:phosphatidylinositol alpha-mannosyltransferase
LNRCSVFCAPSLGGESFGIVLLEAMAAGAPLVASDIDGYRQVASDGVEALLVPPGDPAALAAGIRRVLGDGSLRDGLVARGRERAERYSMASLAEAYLAIYRGLLDAEESKEIVVGRSRLLRLYEDRILRRGPATDRSSG